MLHQFVRRSSTQAQAVVDNLLYNVSLSKSPSSRHILSCLVNNEPGVLARVIQILLMDMHLELKLLDDLS